ncbi:HTH DNA binding domain protein [Halalkalicoccus paucihalophilus]|uniref:HTH DNA binding domain protein n=1 Tax=Halalkalicoccus paucihalophilus TaxID=1008153 RepID=A0A151A895_9EURY|nr:helix-turn-helix domain-containing protein [Halalkalicoccus paucihalophilus]KYH23891.1 HTH DNA binding domain protein [Halalkalicoccus paucihalophilus]
MASIIEFRIPVDQVALAHTVEGVSDLHIEIDRFVGRSTDSVLPFAWVDTNDIETFEQTLREDPTIKSFAKISEIGDDHLYRLHWAEDVKDVLNILLDEDAVLRSAAINTSSKAWEFQLMCTEHADLSKIYVNCEEKGLSLTIDAIYKLDSNEESQNELSEQQHTALSEANERGYYEIPRAISLSELADEFEVSHQALSVRLRRAHGHLVDREMRSTTNPQANENSES